MGIKQINPLKKKGFWECMMTAKYLGVCTIFGYMTKDSFQLYIYILKSV